MTMEASSERESSPAGSVGFYQEGPATSDRGEEESESDGDGGAEGHDESESEEDKDNEEDEGKDLDSDDEDEESNNDNDDSVVSEADARHHQTRDLQDAEHQERQEKRVGRGRGLIDWEASEDESNSGSEESGSDDEGGSDYDNDGRRSRRRDFIDLEASDDDGEEPDDDPENKKSTRTFEPFMRLPLELREKIWDVYNPYLRSRQGRILTCVITDSYRPRIIETQVLSTITHVTNTMLAVHRETRKMAEKYFPHSLESGTELGKIRFDRDRDILFLTSMGGMNVGGEGGSRGPLRRYDIGSIFESVGEFKHLAVEHSSIFPLEEWVEAEHVRDFLGRLETLYLYFQSSEVRNKDLRWCWSLPTREFRVKTEEESAGLGEDAEYLYVWVNRDSEEWDRTRMGRECEGIFSGGEEGAEDWLEWEELSGVRICPMAEFAFEDGMRQFEMLEMKWEMGWEAEDVFSDDEDDDGEGGGEPNEYESEGIDDDTIDEDEGDEDEDDLVVVQDAGSDDENDSRPPTLDGGSPRVIDDDDDDDVMEVSAADLPANVLARFSSDEDNSLKRSAENSEEEDEETSVQRTGRAKRSRVIDSDDDEEDEDERPRKTARRQAPVVISDDDDEDDSEVQEVSSQPVQQKSRRGRRRPAAEDLDEASSSEESSEEESQSEDEEQDNSEEEQKASNRPMTLAERLRLFKSDNPVPGEMDVSDHSSDDDDDEDGGHERDSDDEEGHRYMDEDTFEAEWDGEDGDDDRY